MDDIHLFLNGSRGVGVAQELACAGHQLAAIYVPAKSKSAPSLIQTLEPLGVPVTTITNPNDSGFLERYRAAKPHLAIIAGYSDIFHEPVIRVPALGTINLHGGPLPAYRGGSPLNWQLINGEAEIGISVIRVDAGIDTGDVLAEMRIPATPRETIATLQEKTNAAFPRLTLDVVDDLERGKNKGRVQDPAQAKYWHQRNRSDGRLHWSQLTASEADRMIRALTRPYPGAFCYLGNQQVSIFAAHIPDEDIRGVAGRVCHIQGRGPYVVCRDRALILNDYEIDNQIARLPHGAQLD